MNGAELAALDLALEANPLDAAALRARCAIMLEMDNPHEIAHAARMLLRDHRDAVLLDHCIVRLLNQADPPRNVSIGGGPNYHYAGWLNYDSAAGPLNPWPIEFTPQFTLPGPSGYARLVYSSHCLEHLDDATVARVLDQARRVLRPDGALILKLPDWEQVLERWRAGDEAYFDQWGMGKVIPTWKNMGVEPTIHAKAAMIFCGWWNDAYGDEFGNRTPDAEGAYHGPPVFRSKDTHETLAEYASISDLATVLRGRVPMGGHYNHRSAWSRAELAALLEAHGFALLSQDADEICRRYAAVPGIDTQRAISQYAVAA